jgi:hypothetical protein
MRKLLTSLGVLAVLVASSASAQTSPVPTGKSGVLSIQPISAMLTVYSGEGELALNPSVTLGAGATYWDAGSLGDDNITYLSGDLKLRYYPEAHALQGFSFGGSVGLTRVAEADTISKTSPSIGVMLEYSWLLGASKSFYIATGLGAKAVFISSDDFGENVTARYPTARLSVGFAF